jgi:hypothetical protein
MSGREVDTIGFGPVVIDAQQTLDATQHVARRIAAENPHALDDTMPGLAGRLVGQDPAVAAGLIELLAALGLPTTANRLRAVKAQSAIEQRHKETS